MHYFYHARVHRQFLAALTAARDAAPALVPGAAIVTCPTCGDSFFPHVAPGEPPALLAADIDAALRRLTGECPDHAHRFVVGEGTR